MLYFLIFVATLGGSILGCYFYYHPRLKTKIEIDNQTKQENEKLYKEWHELKANIDSGHRQLLADKEALEENQKTAAFWANRITEIQIETDKQVEAYKKRSYDVAEKELQEKLKLLQQTYETAELDYKKEYLSVLQYSVDEFEKLTEIKTKEINNLDKTIEDERSKVAAIVEDNKRRAEEENSKDFYRLNLTVQDKNEIIKLREITPYLRNPEPLNKVIWKVYYEKPYTDLIGRVVGSGVHTGIYKITYIENGMCYVGQAANIADRWKTHIKRGMGAEAPINNKLYPAMLRYGVENFTFEIIEECERSKLNEREDYWQDFFKAKEFGYSIK